MENRDTEHRADNLPAGTAEEQPGRERTSIDRDAPPPEDPVVRREERAAAAEAGQIGGPGPDFEGDEASRPVAEAGGGVAEGFEESERELTEQASHGENRWSPEADEFPAESEYDRPARAERDADAEELTPKGAGDRAAPVYGEADEVDPTEVVEDPREGPDDPGRGPGIAPDR